MKRNTIAILAVISISVILFVIFYQILLLKRPDFAMFVDGKEEISDVIMKRGDERWFNVTIEANQNLNGTLRLIVAYSPASVALWSETYPSSPFDITRIDLKPNGKVTFMLKLGVYSNAEPQTVVTEIEGNIQSLSLQHWCHINMEIKQ